jgi:hypothetical protein
MPLDVSFWNRADPTSARDALVETLRYELLGPLEPEEEIEESPLTRYLVGMLAPFGTQVAPEEDEVSIRMPQTGSITVAMADSALRRAFPHSAEPAQGVAVLGSLVLT